jgi:hypothetical protein
MTLLTLPAIDLSSLFMHSWATDRLEPATVHARCSHKQNPAGSAMFVLSLFSVKIKDKAGFAQPFALSRRRRPPVAR